MIKAELKDRWGVYCDTDKLVDSTMELLTKYHHDCTELGVCDMLDVYFTNKKELIDLFMKSENYIGNMRICLDAELERGNCVDEIRRFCEHFPQDVGAKEVLLKYTDENGKTLNDYLRVGIGGFKARRLRYGNVAETLAANHNSRKKFNTDGATWASYEEYQTFYNIISTFRRHGASTLSTALANTLTEYKINGTFVNGMKTSRAFNRVCSAYKVDKLPQYNKLFAQYADMVSGLKRKVKFYISLNPLDYLTMSFGNSWSSCHTIDKRNERGMPSSYHGMYCGGTVSYMLDCTSFITYVHNHATEDHEEGKIYRNMFHYDGGALVQGRIYPQGNDGATDLYREFRKIVQGELSKLLEVNDEWIKRTCGCDNNTQSFGVHYRDYLSYGECNVSYPREMPQAASHVVRIGRERVCPNCGLDISDNEDTGFLTHVNCDDPEEDAEW